MVKLTVDKNKVYLRRDDPEFKEFITSFLTKFEDVSKLDFMNSTKYKKRFKTVKERRDLYTEYKDYITFTRGLLEMIPQDAYVAQYVSEDKVLVPDVTSDEIKTSLDTFDLREDQIVAVRKVLVARRGVIQLPTATGKSSIIASASKLLLEKNPGLKILVLAPTLSTVKNIHETFKVNGLDSSVFGHPKKEISSSITASLVQSLITASDKDPELLSGVGAVFYDECLPSNSEILLPDGSHKTILEIYEDDSINEVLSYNTETESYETRRILRKFRTPFNDRFWKVYYVNPMTGKTCGVSLTNNHKVWTKNRGYVQAQDLTPDDIIKVDFPYLRDTTSAVNDMTYVNVLRVTKNIGRSAPYKYNLEVEGNHNYFASNVLVSNCHHLKCDTWNKLNTLLTNVEYSVGFSALSIDKSEIYETDIRRLSYSSSLIVGCSGRVLMHMDPSYYIKKGIIALPVVMRVSNQVVFPDGFDESNWSRVAKEGLMSTPRTIKIAELAEIFSKYDRKILILVSEKDYAFFLGDYLTRLGIKFGISFGAGKGFLSKGFEPCTETTHYEDEDSLEVLQMLSDGKFNVLVATSHLDEGVDIKSLDACILACGGKKDRKIIQRVGRVLRKSKTGNYAYVVDFTDSGSRVLSRQSRERFNMYKNDIGVPDDLVFDGILTSEVESKFKSLEGLI